MDVGASPAPYGLRAPRYGTPNWRYLRELSSVPAHDDGPIWISELLSFTSKERRAGLNDIGFDFIVEKHGGSNVMAGDVISAMPWQVGAVDDWHSFGMVRFPARASFATKLRDRTFLRNHDVYEAAVEHATVLVCVPTPSMGRPRGLAMPHWRDVPHPPTDDDSPVLVAHLTRYATGDDASCPESLAAHTRILAEASLPHGARDTRTFAVEATVVASGVDWHELRLTAYPSLAAVKASFQQLTAHDAYPALRDQLIERHLPIVVKPTINQLAGSMYR